MPQRINPAAIVGRGAAHLLLAGFSLLTVFPLWFMIVTAFKGQLNYSLDKIGPPHNVTLENFAELFQSNQFLIWAGNSLLLTAASVFISVACGSMAGFAFGLMDFRSRRLLFNLIVSLLAIPPVVIVVPLFVMMAQLDLVNRYSGVILIYIGFLLPQSIFMMTSFFRTVEKEMLDAATIDGCSAFQLFLSVVLPISAPAIITLSVANVVFAWNELLVALVFLQTDSMRTLMVGLATFKSLYNINVPVIMAGLLLATVPTVLLYGFGQRYFVRGLTLGSVR
jgi:ABC-type glycerol-3-phosphate transport system permease component